MEAASPTSLATASHLKWSSDSMQINLTCPAGPLENCLKDFRDLESEAVGSLRSLIYKAALQWKINPHLGLTAYFQSSDSTVDSHKSFRLNRLDLYTTSGVMTLLPFKNKFQVAVNNQVYCHLDRCLDSFDPKSPVDKFIGTIEMQNHKPSLTMKPLTGKKMKPIWRGEIVELEVKTNRLKLYHGQNIFSYYSGDIQFQPGLRQGAIVGLDDTLGFFSADSIGCLNLMISKNGFYLNPLTYFGISSQAEMGNHEP